MTTFQDLGLDPLLLKSLETEGYTTPTPIQAQAIPVILAGKDLLGIAQTGTGKTAAFALPILQRLAADRRPTPRKGTRVLILSPTRELANQIGESFKTYGRHMGFSVAVVYGGVGHRPQTTALTRGVDIVVATPGRLLDHMGERTLSLGSTEMLVLDEADQMMDLGFIRPLRQIISQLPARRQTMFFSATMPHEIGALAAELLREPTKIAVTPIAKTADRVEQKVIFIETAKKRSLLVELFADPAMSRALVFTRTKRGADKVAKHLETAGISVSAIHGNKSQGQREAALWSFKNAKIRALIATDIAARGIDIEQVSHVINFELPNVPESYVHRIGRTARAGLEGIAISLCDGEERAYLRDIERLTRQTIPSLDRRGDSALIAPPSEPKSREPARSHRGGERGGDFGHAKRGPRPERSESRGRSWGEGRGDKPRGSDQSSRAPRDSHQKSGWAPRIPGVPGNDETKSNGARPESGREVRRESRPDSRPESRGAPRDHHPRRSDDTPRHSGGPRHEHTKRDGAHADARGERPHSNGHRRPGQHSGQRPRPAGEGHSGPRRDNNRGPSPHGTASEQGASLGNVAFLSPKRESTGDNRQQRPGPRPEGRGDFRKDRPRGNEGRGGERSNGGFRRERGKD